MVFGVAAGTYVPATTTPTPTPTPTPAPAPSIGSAQISSTMDSTSYTIAAGASVTFTAAVMGSSGTPTGNVAFKDNGNAIAGCESVALASGKAMCTTLSLAAGSHPITGAYSGDATYAVGVAGPITQTVTAAVVLPASFSMDSSAYTIHRGDSVTFRALVPGAGGTVKFTDNNSAIAGCAAVSVSANGVATCTTTKLNVGTHTVRGTYSGTSLYGAGVAGPITQTVLK